MTSTTRAILDSITPSDHVVVHTNVQLWDVHVVETIEIALHAQASGAKVTVVVCFGSLSSCPANALHSETLCGKCNSKTEKLVEFLKHCQITVVSIPEFTLDSITRVEVSNITTLKELTEFRVSDAPIGLLTASQIADDLKDVYFALTDAVRERALRHCENGAALLKWSTHLLQEFKATKVFVWNGRRPSDGPFYYAAKSLGLEAFTYISGGKPGQIVITRGPSVQERPLAEVNADIAAIAHQIPEATAVGMSRLEDYRSGTLQQVGYQNFAQPVKASLLTDELPASVVAWLRSRSTRVFLPTSSPSERIHITEVDALFEDDPYAWIERLQTHAHQANLSLLVRWHPAQNRPGTNELARIHAIAAAAPPSVVHILPAESIDAYLLAAESDVVVTTGSTVAIWAAAMSKPVIHLDTRPHFLDGAWTRVSTEAALWNSLEEPRSSNPEVARLWSLYTTECGEEMRFVPWIDDKPQAPHLPKPGSLTFSAAVRRVLMRLRNHSKGLVWHTTR